MQYRVKNFEKYQSCGTNPTWLKLYTALLNDHAFNRLPDASKFHLIGIWILASQTGNQIPNDADYIGQRIGATEPVDLDVLKAAGFLLPAQKHEAPKVPAPEMIGDIRKQYGQQAASWACIVRDHYRKKHGDYPDKRWWDHVQEVIRLSFRDGAFQFDAAWAIYKKPRTSEKEQIEAGVKEKRNSDCVKLGDILKIGGQ